MHEDFEKFASQTVKKPESELEQFGFNIDAAYQRRLNEAKDKLSEEQHSYILDYYENLAEKAYLEKRLFGLQHSNKTEGQVKLLERNLTELTNTIKTQEEILLSDPEISTFIQYNEDMAHTREPDDPRMN